MKKLQRELKKFVVEILLSVRGMMGSMALSKFGMNLLLLLFPNLKLQIKINWGLTFKIDIDTVNREEKVMAAKKTTAHTSPAKNQNLIATIIYLVGILGLGGVIVSIGFLFFEKKNAF